MAVNEFKFSCPACGQHLAAEAGYVGRQIACPACQQTITVPAPATVIAPSSSPQPAAAPQPAALAGLPGATGASKRTSGLALASLICSCATVVAGPLGAIPGVICGHLARRQIQRDPSLGGRRLATAGLFVGYGLLLVFMIVAGLVTWSFVKHYQESMRQAAQPVLSSRPSADPAWTMRLDGVATPAEPARGRLQGRPFQPDQVLWQNGWLKFRQGREFFPDQELSLVLFEEELSKLAGRTLRVPGEGGTKPHVWLSWKEPAQTLPQQKAFQGSYVLRLEFGAMAEGKLSGKIYVCLSDEAKSFLRGTFEVEVKPTSAPPPGRAPQPRPPVVPPGKPKPDGGPV